MRAEGRRQRAEGGGRRAESRESREKMRWWQHQDKENGNGIPGVRRAGTDYLLQVPATTGDTTAAPAARLPYNVNPTNVIM